MACRIFLILLLLTSCTNPKTTNESADDADSLQEYATRIVQKTDSILVEEQCVRGQAESIVKDDIYPGASFKINDDNLSGIEVLKLTNGDMLTIRNWGCDYFVLTFRFETERFEADTADVKYWLEKAVVSMREIENGLDAPLDIKGGTLATENFVKANKDYSFGEEIVYHDDLIRSFVTIGRIQKIAEKRYAFEISYAMGPL